MRRFLGISAAAVAIAAAWSAAAFGLMAAPRPAAQRVFAADVVVVGKVTAIEKDTVDAAPYPGAPNKVAHRVAVVKIESPLAGADGVTHLKVGFVPPAAANPVPGVLVPQPAPGVLAPRPRPVRPGLRGPELKEGQEFLFFLARHPDGGFHIMPPMSPPLDPTTDAGKKEIEMIKKVLAAVADPMKGLKSTRPEERFFTAAALLSKYRTTPDFVRDVEEVPIPAEEGQLILRGLLDGDWAKFDPQGAPNAAQAFYQLRLTDKNGWVQPKVQPKPGGPPVNYNELLKTAYAKWLDGPGKDYQIRRVVPKTK